jgi:hypothetical protein
MSRKAIAVAFVLYFVAAVAFGTLHEQGVYDPFPAAERLGYGIGFYLFTGALPLIVWGCLGFERTRAKTIFYVWAVLGVLLGGGLWYLKQIEIDKRANASQGTDDERPRFTRVKT